MTDYHDHMDKEDERRAEAYAAEFGMTARCLEEWIGEVAHQFPKTCACCATTYEPEDWLRLPLTGVGYTPYGINGITEWRQCSCDNTMTIEVERRI